MKVLRPVYHVEHIRFYHRLIVYCITLINILKVGYVKIQPTYNGIPHGKPLKYLVIPKLIFSKPP